MTDQKKLLLFAENESQLSELVNFAILTGAHSVDFTVLKRKTEAQETALLSHQPEELAKGLSMAAKEGAYNIIALTGTKVGREIAPRLAVLLHSGYVEGVIGVQHEGSGLLFQRQTLGGTCLETIKVNTQTIVITVQSAREFATQESTIAQNEIRVFSDKGEKLNFAKELVEERFLEISGNIQSAERIVAIGRGIKKKEDIAIIEELARTLNASIGVTRPLVEDLKWYPKEKQIGLSGNAVRPRLYIGLGISGQIQHIVGMRDSKVIVAVNKDKTAPMLSFADYSVIGDLYAIVPEITRQLKEELSATRS